MNAYRYLQRAVPPLLLFSFFGNLGMLISPLFMMQVLDRVVPSGNVATLILLAGLAVSAMLALAIVEWCRDLVLQRLSNWSEGVGTALILTPQPNDPDKHVENREKVARVAALAQFLTTPAALAGLSLPWLPLFCVVLCMIHPGFLLLLLALLSIFGLVRKIGHLLDGGEVNQLTHLSQREKQVLEQSRDHADRLGVAMIEQHLLQKFRHLQAMRHRLNDAVSVRNTVKSSMLNTLRSLGQILALGLGAYLVSQGTLSAGGMIAASLILSRSYVAFEAVVVNWRDLQEALHNYRVLSAISDHISPLGIEIESFNGGLRAEDLTIPRGGGAPPLLERVSFELSPGECLVIVGGSGAGKTSLLRALSGLVPAPIGSTFFDESELRALGPEALYRITGYLPQRADLVPGSIAENISCFEQERHDDRVIEAAKSAGVHGLIAALPQGYESDLSQAPYLLSAGQVQRVALARALYNKPRYLFLDEPNALLDGDGERALMQTLMRLKAEGTTIVMVLHRSGVMGLADKILRLEQGRIVDFGPRTEVLARLSGNRRRIVVPCLLSSLQDLRDWVASQFTRSTDEGFSQKAQLVAMELFHLAIASQMDTGQASAEIEFQLKFLNEFECELRMIGAIAPEAADKMVRIRKEIADGKVPSSKRARDEVALAALTEMSSHFSLQNQQGVTIFDVSLRSGLEGSPVTNVAGGRVN